MTTTATATLSVNAQWTSNTIAATEPNTVREGGNVAFENENYKVTVSDTGQVIVHNKRTGEEYEVWGDPHVKVDGEQAFDFWGQTTFQLEDGTKITIETTPLGDNGATYASKVTISDGDYAVEISGVDPGETGDLHFTEHHGHGQMVDGRVDDGNVIFENPDGSGFVTADGKAVDQAHINGTDLIKNGGTGGPDVPTPRVEPGPDQAELLNGFLQAFQQLLNLYSDLFSVSFNGNAQPDGQGGDNSYSYSFSLNITLVRSDSHVHNRDRNGRYG